MKYKKRLKGPDFNISLPDYVLVKQREEWKSMCEKLAEAGDDLWGVVANAAGGNWKNETEEWEQAAQRCRDNYFKAFDEYRKMRGSNDKKSYPWPMPDRDEHIEKIEGELIKLGAMCEKFAEALEDMHDSKCGLLAVAHSYEILVEYRKMQKKP